MKLAPSNGSVMDACLSRSSIVGLVSRDDDDNDDDDDDDDDDSGYNGGRFFSRGVARRVLKRRRVK